MNAKKTNGQVTTIVRMTRNARLAVPFVVGIVVGLIATVATAAPRPVPVGIVSSTDRGTESEIFYHAPDLTPFGIQDSQNKANRIFRGVAAADFDGDGIDEIAVAANERGAGANYDYSEIFLYEFNQLNQYFDTMNPTGRFSSIDIGDVNNDGQPDVVVTNIREEGTAGDPHSAELRIYTDLRNQNSTNIETSPEVGGQLEDLAVGNFDSDPNDEIIVIRNAAASSGDPLEQEAILYDHDGTRLADTPNRLDEDWNAVVAGNFNKNGTATNFVYGIEELCCANKGRARFRFADADVPSITDILYNTPTRNGFQVALAAGNFDNDAFDELVALVEYDGSAIGYLELFDHDGSYLGYVSGTGMPVAVETGDIDRDGLDEIAVLWSGGDLGSSAQLQTYDVANGQLTLLNTSSAFTGAGTDVTILFREAAIPEPATAMLTVLPIVGLMLRRR